MPYKSLAQIAFHPILWVGGFMPRHANLTSFQIGREWTEEQKQKRSATIREKYAKGEWVPPMAGKEVTQETINKRRKTARLNCLGNRHKETRDNKQYWVVMTMDGKRYEHRVVMEHKLGRKLESWEHVHHINEDGLDNDPNNLELVTNSEHKRKHPLSQISIDKMVKSISLPEGKWSKVNDYCILCGRSDRPHASHGRCNTCNERWTRQKKAKE